MYPASDGIYSVCGRHLSLQWWGSGPEGEKKWSAPAGRNILSLILLRMAAPGDNKKEKLISVCFDCYLLCIQISSLLSSVIAHPDCLYRGWTAPATPSCSTSWCHSPLYWEGSPIWLHADVDHCLSLLCKISLSHDCTKNLFIHLLLMGFSVISSLRLLCIMLLWTFW